MPPTRPQRLRLLPSFLLAPSHLCLLCLLWTQPLSLSSLYETNVCQKQTEGEGGERKKSLFYQRKMRVKAGYPCGGPSLLALCALIAILALPTHGADGTLVCVLAFARVAC